MSLFQNGALLAAYIVYFFLAFVLPTLVVWRRTGKNAYVLSTNDDVSGFVTRTMKVLMGALFAYLLMQLLWPSMLSSGNAVPPAVYSTMRYGGWTLLCVAILWTSVAQYQMGRSWRIGIDLAEPTPLVAHGLFAWSRNPIFLAMRACLLALVLIQPNGMTLALWLVGDIIMQLQVRLEEQFLGQQHGAAYAAYRAQVPRWL